MIAATMLAIFIVPVLYVVIGRITHRTRQALGPLPSPAPQGTD